MGLFWKRKSRDQFVTLGLNEPPVSQSSQAEPVTSLSDSAPEPVIHEELPRTLAKQPVLEPVATGAESLSEVTGSAWEL